MREDFCVFLTKSIITELLPAEAPGTDGAAAAPAIAPEAGSDAIWEIDTTYFGPASVF